MISVVIPLYNKAHTIINTLNTVLNQTYKDFEVIVVNDGSTDNSVEVINQNFNDKRIRIINQENAGVSAARNTGIKESKGDWISFLDADDEWLPDYLEFVSTASVMYNDCKLILVGRYSQNYKTRIKTANIPIKLQNKVTRINFYENPHVFAHISATTIESKILKENYDTWGRFIEGQKSNEDFTFLFRVALHVNTIYVGIPLSIYNGNVENQATSQLQKQKKINDNIIFQNKVIEEYLKLNNNKYFEIFMRYSFRHSILQLIKKRDYNTIRYIISRLNETSKKLLFNKIEQLLYINPMLNFCSIIYIYITKLVWRSHGFPIVK